MEVFLQIFERFGIEGGMVILFVLLSIYFLTRMYNNMTKQNESIITNLLSQCDRVTNNADASNERWMRLTNEQHLRCNDFHLRAIAHFDKLEETNRMHTDDHKRISETLLAMMKRFTEEHDSRRKENERLIDRLERMAV